MPGNTCLNGAYCGIVHHQTMVLAPMDYRWKPLTAGPDSKTATPTLRLLPRPLAAAWLTLLCSVETSLYTCSTHL